MTAAIATRLPRVEPRPSPTDRLIIRAGLLLVAWGRRRRAARRVRPDFAAQCGRIDDSRERLLTGSGLGRL